MSQPLANPKKPPRHHQRGLTPLMLHNERKRFGRLPAPSSIPNLLRHVGTSPTVAEANEHPGTQHHQRGLTPLMLRASATRSWALSPSFAIGLVCYQNQAQKKPLRSRALGPTNAKGLVGYPLRLAHQTCCDMSGRARPSRRRHYQRGLTPLMLLASSRRFSSYGV